MILSRSHGIYQSPPTFFDVALAMVAERAVVKSLEDGFESKN
jgi:hypothetical protein